MATTATSPTTEFTRDVLGRYVCNGLDEARASADRGRRPDARPFDVIIVGGGTFGAALAEHLWFRDKAHRHRILALEGGPFLLPEHVQNLPVVGLGVADATSLADLWRRSPAEQAAWRKEVWGLAWHANVTFPGLAYCLGGRSLYWGGWSPRLLDTELAAWPAPVVSELDTRYFAESEQQIGVAETNDFIYGDLQNALRQQLYASLMAGKITDAIALGLLPDHPAVRGRTPTASELRALLGVTGNGGTVTALRDELKLEAPLAVQGRPPRAGFFPLNKFSAMPLLMKAAREAQAEARNDDVKKRLMIVPNCHVTHLVVEGGRATRVLTNQGDIGVPADGVVVLALGTIESTRLALNSFGGVPGADLIGRNLIGHLRSNLTIRFPRTALASLSPQVRDLQAGALFVKGRHTHTDGSGRVAHFQRRARTPRPSSSRRSPTSTRSTASASPTTSTSSSRFAASARWSRSRPRATRTRAA